MNAIMNTKLTTALAVTCCMLALLAQPADAQTTWNAGNGNWDTDANWTAGEPISGQQATVNNGSTVTANMTGEIAGALTVSGGSTVNVDAGDLTFDKGALSLSLSVSSGTLNVTGGAVTALGVVNNFLNNSGSINVSAGSFTHTATNLRFGDGGNTGTMDVSGTGSWSSGNLNIIGTGIINLTGSSAQISGVSINNSLGGNVTVDFTPDSGGINAIGVTNLNLSNTDTLIFDTDLLRGPQTVDLFSYSGTRTSTFNTESILSVFGNLTLGSDPLGDPSNLGLGEYFLDYGTGSNDNVTLFYNAIIPEPSSCALMLVGLAGLGLGRRCRRR